MNAKAIRASRIIDEPQPENSIPLTFCMWISPLAPTMSWATLSVQQRRIRWVWRIHLPVVETCHLRGERLSPIRDRMGAVRVGEVHAPSVSRFVSPLGSRTIKPHNSSPEADRQGKVRRMVMPLRQTRAGEHGASEEP